MSRALETLGKYKYLLLLLLLGLILRLRLGFGRGSLLSFVCKERAAGGTEFG